MKPILAGLVTVALVTPGILFAQAGLQPAATSYNAIDSQELIKLEDAVNAALVSRNVTLLDYVYAGDLIDTDDDGEVETKAELLWDLRSGDLKITVAKNDEYKIHVYENVAVVNFRCTINGKYKNEDISGRYRDTNTWIKRAGRWQCVAVHESEITD